MNVKGSVALVTGANRGLGAAFVRGLLAEGATTVYAASRSPFESDQPGVVPVRLDITDPAQVEAAAARLTDVDLVVNNAGVSHETSLLGEGIVDALRADLETNLFGTLAVSRAFAPILAANGGGALINVLSVLSWYSFPDVAAYGASKAAEWHLTNSLRVALRPANTQVMAVHSGYIDTDMAAHVDAPKVAPDDMIVSVLDALAGGREEVLIDDLTRQVKVGLSADIAESYPVNA